jgi:hypothetical protein
MNNESQTKELRAIEDFPPRTQAFLRANGFHDIDQLCGHERGLALLAAVHEVEATAIRNLIDNANGRR